MKVEFQNISRFDFPRNVPAALKYKADPKDPGLLRLVKPFLSNDELRVSLTGINFDKNGICATDAMMLLFLPAKSKFKGIYRAGTNEKIKEKYPDYPSVIPNVTEYRILIDPKKLLLVARACLPMVNKYTSRLVLTYDGHYIGMNGIMLAECLETAIRLGWKDVYINLSTPNRAMIFTPSKGVDLKTELILLMPMMLETHDAGLFFSDIDTNLEAAFRYDLEKNGPVDLKGKAIAFDPDKIEKAKIPFGLDEKTIRLLKKRTGKGLTPALETVMHSGSTLMNHNVESKITLDIADKYRDTPGLYRIFGNTFLLDESLESSEYTDHFPQVSEKPALKLSVSHLKNLADVCMKVEDYENFSGIFVDGVNNKLVSTDRNILLAYPITSIPEKKSVILGSANHLAEFLATVSDHTCELSWNDKVYSLKGNGWRFEAYLVEHTYPNWKSIIPEAKELNRLALPVDLKPIGKKYPKAFLSIEPGKTTGLYETVEGHEHATTSKLIQTLPASITESGKTLPGSFLLVMPLKTGRFYQMKYMAIAAGLASGNLDIYYQNNPIKPILVALQHSPEGPGKKPTEALRLKAVAMELEFSF